MSTKSKIILSILVLTMAMGCEKITATELPSTPSYAGAYTPIFEEAECPFPIPEGFEPGCGYLLIPENRALPEGRLIRLGVAIFHSTDPSSDPDPVIHLTGGPGSSALNFIELILQSGGVDILKHRDYILFDQRGTRFSDPFLYCQPFDEYLWDAHELDLSLEEYNDGALPFLAGCLQDWRTQGIDLAAYTSTESASDVNDLRLALGYDQVNLYGTSYGTRLALTVMRDHPEGIRSVILDSIEPIQEELGFDGLAFNADRSLQLVFQACEEDASCSHYGDLEDKFYAVIQNLEENPLTIETYGPYREEPYEVILDGDLFIDIIFGSLYSMVSITDIPFLIDAAYQGKYDEFSGSLGGAIGMPGSTGLYWTTECREEAPFASKWRQFVKSFGIRDALEEHFAAGYIGDVCELWDVPPADPVENKGVVGDIPTILFTGRFDPITPPPFAELVAKQLSFHYLYEFSDMSHGVMRSNPCALQMGLAFLDDPGHAPDSSCMDKPTSLEFR